MEVTCHSRYIPWIKRFILIAGIIPMLALTINDLIPLLKDYNDIEKNVLTQVSIEMNKSIPRPNITVCIPYYSTALDTIEEWLTDRDSNRNLTPPEAFMAMKNHSWDDVWNINTSVFNTSAESIAKIVKRVVQLDEETQFPEPDPPELVFHGKDDGFDWNQPIMDAVWRYLISVIMLDRILTPPYQPYDIPLIMHSGIGAIPRQVGQVSNEEMDRLFRRVLDAFLYNYYSGDGHPASVGWMDEGASLCLQPDVTESSTYNESVDESVDDFMLFSYRFRAYGNTSGRGLRVFDDPSIMYSSLTDPYYAHGTYVAETAGISAIMTLTYSVESRLIENRTDRVCSKDVSSAMCFANHQVNLTIEHCHCIPFAYRFLRDNPDNVPYCHPVHYQSCHEKLMESAKKNMDLCSRKCEYTFYRWTPTILESKIPNHSFDLLITPLQVTPYLEFKIVDKINLHELFSQLGGSIGFYLGFSCLTGFGIIGLLIEFIIKRYKARKGMHATAENGANSMWTFLWTKNFLSILANRAEDDKREKMEDVCKELNELKKETSQLRSLIDHNRIENEKQDEIRCQKMDEEMDKRMVNLSKQFTQQSELVMKMLLQLKDDTDALKKQTQCNPTSV